MRDAGKTLALREADRLLWALVAAGLTNNEIGRRFGFSGQYAGFRVFDLLFRIGCRNRIEAAVKWHGGDVARARKAAENLAAAAAPSSGLRPPSPARGEGRAVA